MHEKKLLTKQTNLINKWPNSFSFQLLRYKFTLSELDTIHKLNIIIHFEKNVNWLRVWIRKFIYNPLFSWLHDYHFWKNKFEYYLISNVFWSCWFQVYVIRSLQYEYLLLIWLKIVKPYLFNVLNFNFQILNAYWWSFRYQILSNMLDFIWRPGYIIKYGPWYFKFDNWFYDLSESQKKIFMYILLPFYSAYSYFHSSYLIYIELIYPTISLNFWLIFGVGGKFILYFFKFLLINIKFLTLSCLKIISFNVKILGDSIIYLVLSVYYIPIILIRFLLSLKQVGGMFLHNCNFLLLISTLKFVIRKVFLNYNINIFFFNKFSVYLFMLNHYILNKIIFNIYWVSILLTIGSLAVFSPYVMAYDYILYNFLEFATSYTHLYFENKINLDGLKPVKFNFSTNQITNYKNLHCCIEDRTTIINYTILGVAIISVCSIFIYLLDFNNLYITNNI